MEVSIRKDSDYPLNSKNQEMFVLEYKQDRRYCISFTLNELFDIMYALIKFFKSYMEANNKKEYERKYNDEC
jgi:hypothetical protein